MDPLFNPVVYGEQKRIRACCLKSGRTSELHKAFFFVEMGHIVCLPLSELKVIWDNRGSGAAGLCTHLCVFMCFICGVVKWFEGK